jgi:hypothetical protein
MVFWASTATLITTLGVVPLQAGIFTAGETTSTFEQQFLLSHGVRPSNLQTSSSVVQSSQSVYGLLRLNETLPPFMTLNYTLSPFVPLTTPKIQAIEETWTSTSTLFGMDLDCHEVMPTWISPNLWFDITEDCRVDLGSWEPNVIGEKHDWVATDDGGGPEAHYKTYTSYYSPNVPPYSIWSSNTNCTLYSTFFTAFARNILPSRDNTTTPDDIIESSLKNITAVACAPYYYEREVEATVDAKTRTPIEVKLLGPKTSLSEQSFNASTFEGTIMHGSGSDQSRSNGLPDTNLPQYLSGLLNSELTLFENWNGESPLHPLTAMALSSSPHKMEDFLDSQILEEAYEIAFKLLFARAMNSFLQVDSSLATTRTTGKHSQHLEAVVLEPLFTYSVQGLLALISLSMGALLYFSMARKCSKRLRDDPGMSHRPRKVRQLIQQAR